MAKYSGFLSGWHKETLQPDFENLDFSRKKSGRQGMIVKMKIGFGLFAGKDQAGLRIMIKKTLR